MNKPKPRWVLLLLLLVLLYGAALLGYRGSRSLSSLEKASGRVQQLSYERAGSRNQAMVLLLRLEGAPVTLRFNAGPRTGSTVAARTAQWEQQLRAARVVTAYYEADPVARETFLYQLEADGVVLISLSQSTFANRIGSLGFLLMLLVTAYFGRKQLLLSPPPKALRHARRPR